MGSQGMPEYFLPTGGICVASCHNKVCEEMRSLAREAGHSVAVCYQQSIFEFVAEYRTALEKHAKNASACYVISNDGEFGKTQMDEMKLLDEMGIRFETVTWKQYRDKYTNR